MRMAIFAEAEGSGESSLVLPPRYLSSVELRGEPVEARLPQVSVPAHPIVKLAERLRAQRVEPPPAIRTDAHESGLLEDGELPRDARLTDVHDLDQLVHGALARPERLDEATAEGARPHLGDPGHGDILLAQHMSLQQCLFSPPTPGCL